MKLGRRAPSAGAYASLRASIEATLGLEVNLVEPHKGNGPGPKHWIWSDGTPWDFETWGPGEPNNCGGREDRVQLMKHFQYKWNDIHKEHPQVAVYKRGGRPLDHLVCSSEPAAVTSYAAAVPRRSDNASIVDSVAQLMPRSGFPGQRGNNHRLSNFVTA